METKETVEKFGLYDFALKIVTPEKLKHDVTVVYLHGLAGNPNQYKPKRLCDFSMEAGVRFCSYELSGHANNLEKYDSAGMYDWIDQLEYLILNRIPGKIILMGSCIGGIIGLIVGQKHHERFLGLVGIGTADMDWRSRLDRQQNEELKAQGFTYKNLGGYPIPCRISETFVASTEELRKIENITVSFPVHLMHGKDDNISSVDEAMAFRKKVIAPEIIIKLIDKANHRMGDEFSLRQMQESIHRMLKQ